MRRLVAVLVVGGVLGCGGRSVDAPTPRTMESAVTEFLAAVKRNDVAAMARLWGDERGPVSWMKPEELSLRLRTIQKYYTHDGSRLVEGPLAVPGKPQLRMFRVELQRQQCARVVPMSVIQARDGGWLVFDVHLAEAGNPMRPCPPPQGTRP